MNMSIDSSINESIDNPIDIKVVTHYLDEQSTPELNHYVFAYTITITNTGDEAARLMTRHWIITDGNGKRQEVKGDGVIGEQPYLKPGEYFEYTSGTVLETPIGSMEGSYQMQTNDKIEFSAPIPEFVLSTPNALH